MAKRMTRAELIDLARSLLTDLTASTEESNARLLLFAVNSPDPVRAMDLVIEPGGPDTPEALVDASLSFPLREPRSLPFSKLHRDHPLRHMTLEP